MCAEAVAKKGGFGEGNAALAGALFLGLCLRLCRTELDGERARHSQRHSEDHSQEEVLEQKASSLHALYLLIVLWLG